MSQLAKAAIPSTISASSVPRVPTGARSVASLDAGPLDELSPKTAISYEQTEYLFQDFGNDRGGGQRRNPVAFTSLLYTTPEAFTSVLEGLGTETHAASTRRMSAFGMSLAQAIQTYEATARVTSGVQMARGGYFSFHL